VRERYLRFFAFLALATCLPVSSAAWAQSLVSGQVDGTVMDPTGAAAPNATVNLSSSETGFNETTTTNATGAFHFSLVKPGNYTMTVTLSGFTALKRTVVVSLGQVTNVAVQLEVGKAEQTIEVTAESPLLHTENANLASTVDQRTIANIPSPGQDITNYAMTTPGVALSTGAGYGNLTAHGLPGTSNLYTVNGNDYNDPYLNLNNSGASNLLLGANELQEITVVTNGYTGQYGRQAGANVNYTTKGGTNAFHGNAAWYYNGNVMNANDWFNNASDPITPRPHAVSNQWAASIGGPIKKDKLFFFFDAEGLRYVLPGGGEPVYVPTQAFAAATQANINSIFGASSPSSAFYQNIFKLYAGAPGINRATPEAGKCGTLAGLTINGVTFDNGPGTPGINCAQTFRSTVNNLNTEKLWAGTVDWNASSKDTLRFRYKDDRGVQATGTDPINPIFNANSVQPEDDGQMVWTHVLSPRMTNQFIMAGMYYSAIFGPPNIKASLAVFPTTLIFADGAPFNNMGGSDNNYPQGRNVTQIQFVDDFSWTKGRHVIKFGGNFRKNYISDFSMYPNTSGSVTFGSMADFYNGSMGAAGLSLLSQSFANFGVQRVIYYSLGFYAQDEYKVSRNLTLTLALRLDRNSPETCAANCFARFATQFQDLNHDVTIPYNQAVVTGLHQAFPSMQTLAAGPRIGFAWTPNTHFSKPGSTVIRGGFGVFPDLYPGFLADRFITNLPSVSSFSTSSGAITPAEAGSAWTQVAKQNAALQGGFSGGGTQASLGIHPNFNSIANNISNPTYYEWNLQVEQAIGPNTVVSANYVGNHGTNIFMVVTGVNTYCRACGTATHPANFGDLPNVAPDARFASVRQYQNGGISNYEGLTLNLTRRFSKGFQGTFNYTYSHSLDDVSNGGLLPYSTQTGGDSITQQMDPHNINKNYGNSDYDFRHYISANFYYALPLKAGNKALNTLVGGWNTGGTIFFRSGEPFTVYNTNITSGLFGNRTYLTRVIADYEGGATVCSGPAGAGGTGNCLPGATFAAASGQSDFGNVARNFFHGPSYFDMDALLFKDFHITEQTAFTLGATAYNVLNHPNFANPINNAALASFGNIQNTVSQPNSPYGNFQGAAVSGRVLQLMVKFKF
jgi:Carboxypeptidase regulatory-like domain